MHTDKGQMPITPSFLLSLSYWSFQRTIAKNSYKIFSPATFESKKSASGPAKCALETKSFTSVTTFAKPAPQAANYIDLMGILGASY